MLTRTNISVIIISTGKQGTEEIKMVDKKIKDFTKGIEEIAKLHPADQEKVFQMVADQMCIRDRYTPS